MHRILGWSGILPFIAFLILASNQTTLFGMTPLQFFILYSAVIFSFLAGALWGRVITLKSNEQLSDREASQHKLHLLHSNGFALLAFVALIASEFWRLAALLLLALGYWWLLKIESTLHHQTSSAIAYFKMRQQLSYVVLGCHALMLIVVLVTL